MKKVLCGCVALFTVIVLAAQDSNDDRGPRVICTFVKTKVLKMVKPTYPPNAAAHGIGGKATVRVLVNKAGEPEQIKFVEGSPFFSAATIEAVKEWRWEPLNLNGEAVPMETTVTVNFVPRRKLPSAEIQPQKKLN